MFADIVWRPPPPNFCVPPSGAELINGELGVSFSHMEMAKFAENMKFALGFSYQSSKVAYIQILGFSRKTEY